MYFFDPDDYIEPETLEIIYNKAIKTGSDAIQFNFQTIRVSTNIKHAGHNGNKETGLYNKESILKKYLPRFIGYSINDIQEIGSVNLYNKKEMGSVWRFLYRRSIIVNNGILFPTYVRLNEDSLFNCRFFCHATRICYINDMLYTYYSKDNGTMISLLRNSDSLFDNKLAAKNERINLRKLYLEQHKIDIFPLFAGSLFLSAVELMAKSSYSLRNIKRFLEYTNDKDVRKAISIIPIKGNIKIKILLLFFKMRLSSFIFLLMFLANKIGIKIQ